MDPLLEPSHTRCTLEEERKEGGKREEGVRRREKGRREGRGKRE